MVEIIDEELPEEEVAARQAWIDGAYERDYAEVEDARRQAYIRDADPLFFGYQRGENTEQEWLEAVQAIKDANPYPQK
jgi:hypothetical protein